MAPADTLVRNGRGGHGELACRLDVRQNPHSFFRPHHREQDYISDRSLVRQQHHQPIDAKAHPPAENRIK
jgi:hypothetical protein